MTRINSYFAAALVCFFLLSLQALSQTFLDCERFDNVSQSSSYLTNRNTVLSTFLNRSSNGSYYSNATTGLSPNTVYGMFLCRGDLDRKSCSDCVKTIISVINRACFLRKGAYIHTGECIVRYSNSSFFTRVEVVPNTAVYSPNSSVESPRFFNRTLLEKLDKLILRASLLSSSLPVPYFVEDQEHVTQVEGSYDLKALVQCSPDLVPSNCTVCLSLAVQRISECCSHAHYLWIIFPKCLIEYNISALRQTNHGVTKGNEIFRITFIGIMTTLVLLLMDLW